MIIRRINLPASYGEGVGSSGGDGMTEGCGGGVSLLEGGEQASEKGIPTAHRANDGDGGWYGMVGTLFIHKHCPPCAEGNQHLLNPPFLERGCRANRLGNGGDGGTQHLANFAPVDFHPEG